MAGFFDKLRNAGAAYVQHIKTVRELLSRPPEEALAGLSTYLEGLSEASFVGFKLSIAQWANTEMNSGTKQDLQWIVANADALRQGKLDGGTRTEVAESSTPEVSGSTSDFESTLALAESWFSLSPNEALQRLQAKFAGLSSAERQQFVAHLETMLKNSRAHLKQLQANEDKTWGGYVEDRMNYNLASLRTGQADPAYVEMVRNNERMIGWLEWIIAEARNWTPEPPRAPDPPAAESVVNSLSAGEMDEDQFAAMETFLQASIENGAISRDREFAYREILTKLRAIATQAKEGTMSAKLAASEMKQLMAQLRPFRRTAQEHRITENPSTPARARDVLPYIQAIKTFADDGMMEGIFKSPGESTLQELGDLGLRSRRVFEHLTTLGDDRSVVAFERTEVRRLGLKAREIELLPHLTMARPFWDCPPSFVESNRVFFSGSGDSRRWLAESCDQKQLELANKVSARNYGQGRWDLLRSSTVAVFDWRTYQPGLTEKNPEGAKDLAATAYELGLSMALGIPAVVLAKPLQRLPFDIDIEPVLLSGRKKKENQRLLDAALDTAIYGRQRTAIESGLPATQVWLRRSMEHHPTVRTFEKLGFFDPEHVDDPIAFRADVLQLLSRWEGPAPVPLYPAWRAAYPSVEGSSRRLFHVTPFMQPWSASMTKATAKACKLDGITYERGDTSADDRIIRRIWNGICTADFVLVDVTGLSPNVLIELGMAHGLGRKVLLVEQPPSLGRVRNLEKIEVKQYSSASQLQALVHKWLSA